MFRFSIKNIAAVRPLHPLTAAFSPRIRLFPKRKSANRGNRCRRRRSRISRTSVIIFRSYIFFTNTFTFRTSIPLFDIETIPQNFPVVSRPHGPLFNEYTTFYYYRHYYYNYPRIASRVRFFFVRNTKTTTTTSTTTATTE